MVTVFGISIDSKLPQCLKADSPIEVSPSFRIIEVNEHPSNAEIPIVLTLLGMEIVDIDSQLNPVAKTH